MNKQLTELQGQIDFIRADMRQAFERIARLERKPEPKRPVKPFVIYWTGVALLSVVIVSVFAWAIVSAIAVAEPGQSPKWAQAGLFIGILASIPAVVIAGCEFYYAWEEARRVLRQNKRS